MDLMIYFIENYVFVSRLPSDSNPDMIQVQTIGNFNVFETDSMCEALRVGDNNVLEAKGTEN